MLSKRHKAKKAKTDMNIIKALKGTREYDIISGMDQVYRDIEQRQGLWKNTGRIICPEGCGTCCTGFEPDVLESEALYLAAWLMENKPEEAKNTAEGIPAADAGKNGSGCFLFDPDTPWHCTVYAGRCLICRLFGYSGDYGKDGKRRWRPCRFYPDGELARHLPPLEHRQYTEDELVLLFGNTPPAMSDCIGQALALTPGNDGTTVPLRDALPAAIRRLELVIQFNNGGNDNEPLSA